MAFFRTFFVTFLSFLLIILLTLSVVGLSLKVLLYPSVYKNALEGSGAYDLLEEFEQKGGTGSMQLFGGSARSLGEDASDKILAYLRGDIDEKDLTLKIDTSKIIAFFEESAKNFTVCKKGEQPYSGDEVVCRPPEKNSSVFLQEVLMKKNVTISGEVNILDVFDKEGKFQEIKKNVEIFDMAVYTCLLLSLSIIFLIVLLERKNIKAMERWIGADLLLSGIILFAIVFLGSYTLTLIPALESMHSKILPLIANPILERIGLIAFIIFLIACTLLIMSFLGKKKDVWNNQKKQKTVQVQ